MDCVEVLGFYFFVLGCAAYSFIKVLRNTAVINGLSANIY